MSRGTKVISAGNPAVLLPAGDYYVGDPCYAVSHDNHDRWMRQLESVWGEPWPTTGSRDHFGGDYGVIAKDPEGPKWWAAHGTKWGDGQYEGSDGFTYPVDAGLLGVVPAEHAEDNALEIMRLVTFTQPFSITYEEDGGIVSIGYIDIRTDDPEEEYDPYAYLDDEEDDA